MDSQLATPHTPVCPVRRVGRRQSGATGEFLMHGFSRTRFESRLFDVCADVIGTHCSSHRVQL